jgi:hypothetical protein
MQPPDQSRSNLTLAPGEAVHALDEHIIEPLLRFCASTLLEPSRDGRHELFGIDGLGQKVDRSTFHGLDDRPDITVTRYENYREGALVLETSLKLQPRHARQAIVEHEARCAGGGALREERLRRVERPNGKTERNQMARQRCSRPFVVIDDEDISQWHRIRNVDCYELVQLGLSGSSGSQLPAALRGQ